MLFRHTLWKIAGDASIAKSFLSLLGKKKIVKKYQSNIGKTQNTSRYIAKKQQIKYILAYFYN